MSSPFYYTKYDSDIIYFTHNSLKERYEFYVNDKLVDYEEGTFGEYNFEHENYHLKVKTKLKTTHTFSVSGKEIPLAKIKKKELQALLAGKGLHNEVNPTAEQIEQNRFKPQRLLIPVTLMVAGFIIQYIVKEKPDPAWLIPAIPEAIAGWMLYDIVAERVYWLKNMRRARLGFMALVVVGLGFLGEFLFKYL